MQLRLSKAGMRMKRLYNFGDIELVQVGAACIGMEQETGTKGRGRANANERQCIAGCLSLALSLAAHLSFPLSCASPLFHPAQVQEPSRPVG